MMPVARVKMCGQMLERITSICYGDEKLYVQTSILQNQSLFLCKSLINKIHISVKSVLWFFI